MVASAMVVSAPGKLFVTGAYAVLEGAPAIVLAVDRYAHARTDQKPASTRPEVVAIAKSLTLPVPWVDTTELEGREGKIGIGSSAAAVVAAAGALYLRAGKDLGDPKVMHSLLRRARGAHRMVQPRGSGADVAASALGGIVCATLRDGDVQAERLAPSPAIMWRAFALHRPMRTSDALDRLASRNVMTSTRKAMAHIAAAADEGARAFRANDPGALVSAVLAHVAGLGLLGAALDLPLLPPEIDRARDVLGMGKMPSHNANYALLPSGAGGGDTVLWLGARAPTEHETLALAGVGLDPLDLSLDQLGVHPSTLAAKREDAERIR